MRLQLWSQDEYGTGAIVGTYETPTDAIRRASELITDANFGNSLSSSEQMKSLEAYMVELEDSDWIYASNRPDGKHRAVKLGSSETEVLDPKTSSVRIYIGSKFEKQADKSRKETRLYMNDQKGRPVTTILNQSLQGKTFYFLKQIEA